MSSTRKTFDPLAFTKLAIKRKLATQEQMNAAFMEFKQASDSSNKKRDFGAFLVEKEVMTKRQLKDLMKDLKPKEDADAKQKERQEPSEIKETLKAKESKRKGDASKVTRKKLEVKTQLLPESKIKKARKRIGNFELLKKIGEGGMGAVYLAHQLGIEREIALKILPPDLAKESDFQERFFREARAVAKLNHPNIVAGIDVGKANGVYYFAMEFVDGESLGQRLQKKGRLPEKDALEYARQVALALQHAHKHGLLHRDVKPDNILIDSTQTAKLADLGLVRTQQDTSQEGSDGSSLDEENEDAALTRKGKVVGTPYYISPEQARGKKDLTPGTDLYSLGATLFHLLAGKHPYPGKTGGEIMRKHVRDAVPDPREVNPKISAKAAEICMRLMQKDPKDRHPSGQALADDLKGALKEMEPVVIVSTSKRKGASSSRKIQPATPTPKSSQVMPRGTRVHKRVQAHSGGELLIGGTVVAAIALIGLFLMSSGGSRTTVPSRSETNEAFDNDSSLYSKQQNEEKRRTRRKPKPKVAKVTNVEKDPKSAAGTGIEPVDSARPTWQPKPWQPEKTPSITKPEQPQKQGEQDLMKSVDRALASGDVEKAKEIVDKYSGRIEVARFSIWAVGTVDAVDKKWADTRKKLEGETVSIGGLSGKITNVNDSSFTHVFGPGASRTIKWDAITGADRLRLMAYLPDDPKTQAEQGIYLYVRGNAAAGATALLEAHASGKIKTLPEAWKQRFMVLKQQAMDLSMKKDMEEIQKFNKVHDWLRLQGSIQRFRTKYGLSAVEYDAELKAYYEEADRRLGTTIVQKKETSEGIKPVQEPVASREAAPKENPVAQLDKPEKKEEEKEIDTPYRPPSNRYLVGRFKGAAQALSDTIGHIQIFYDFSRPDQLEDFSAKGAELKLTGTRSLRFLPKGKGNRQSLGAVLTHKAHWMGKAQPFSIFMECFVLEEGGGFGSGIQSAEGKYGVVMLGGERNTSGARVILSQIAGDRQSTLNWFYQTNESYRCRLMRQDLYWYGHMWTLKQGSFRPRLVAKKKRSMLPGEWPGYGIIFSNGAKLIIKTITLSGVLHPDYVKELATGK